MVSRKYSLDNLRRAIRTPRLFVEELASIATTSAYSPYHLSNKRRFESRYGPREDVMQKDWDCLFILDGCRYDTFSEVNRIHGELQSMISGGSHSIEFARYNFENRELYDTVYVTANAHVARIAKDSFHELLFTESVGEWASRDGMHPETVMQAARDADEQYPNKRIVVHLMQPHSPYFGETAADLRQKLADDGIDDLGSKQWETGPNLKLAAKRGLISLTQLREVYVENLRFVLQYLEDEIGNFAGKKAITADHGELFGERTGLWKYADLSRQTPNGVPVGHPRNIYVPELRKVPYLVIDSDVRREVVAEAPTVGSDIDEGTIQERLAALGYQ